MQEMTRDVSCKADKQFFLKKFVQDAKICFRVKIDFNRNESRESTIKVPET